MEQKTHPHLSRFVKQISKQLHFTRDEIVRTTGMCSDKASAVWNGKDVKLSYYLDVWKALYERSKDPRYKLSREKLLKTLMEAIEEELSG